MNIIYIKYLIRINNNCNVSIVTYSIYIYIYTFIQNMYCFYTKHSEKLFLFIYSFTFCITHQEWLKILKRFWCAHFSNYYSQAGKINKYIGTYYNQDREDRIRSICTAFNIHIMPWVLLIYFFFFLNISSSETRVNVHTSNFPVCRCSEILSESFAEGIQISSIYKMVGWDMDPFLMNTHFSLAWVLWVIVVRGSSP